MVRTMMVRTNRKWPSCFSTMLWPYVIRMVNNMYNNTPFQGHKNQITPMRAASQTPVGINKN